MTNLISYHNNISIKESILSQLQAHYDADEFVKGKYWENGKGCAVGCTIHGNNHKEYETRFGIPIILARLEDKIFENLPNTLAKEWPIKFMSVISIGADLSKVWNNFAIWFLSDKDYGVINFASSDRSKSAINEVTEIYIKSLMEDVDIFDFRRAAGYAADYTADAAAYSAASTGYASASTGYASADAAAAAAGYAADAAAYSAAAYSDAAADAARSNHYIAQSKKLLELLKDCK